MLSRATAIERSPPAATCPLPMASPPLAAFGAAPPVRVAHHCPHSAAKAATAAPIPEATAHRSAEDASKSPLIRKHLNVHGRYFFALPDLSGGLRQLSDPDAGVDEED